MATSFFRSNRSTFDDEEWVDYVPVRAKRTGGESSGLARLFGLFLLVLTGLCILSANTLRIEGGGTLWQEMRDYLAGPTPAEYGGLDFGMSPEKAMRTRPDMNLTVATGGELAGTYTWNGVRFTVGFAEVGGNLAAYRFHSARVVADDDAEAFLHRLVNRHGAPVESACGQRIFAPVSFCHFGWLTEGGVALRVTTKPLAGESQKRSEVTVVASDSFLANKRVRTALAR